MRFMIQISFEANVILLFLCKTTKNCTLIMCSRDIFDEVSFFFFQDRELVCLWVEFCSVFCEIKELIIPMISRKHMCGLLWRSKEQVASDIWLISGCTNEQNRLIIAALLCPHPEWKVSFLLIRYKDRFVCYSTAYFSVCQLSFFFWGIVCYNWKKM